ncbi:MAG: hypothetical protein JO047_07155 [Alphaproteobacteria bacterium]|nr:hypothetical protein [Alphaproteobacteria bacterium]
MSTPATHVWVPSCARVVVLDGFVPVPRGTPAAAPAPASWPAKDPKDVLDYQFDISAALVGNPGDGISTLDVTISPNNSGDLALHGCWANGAAAVLWLAGGQVGTTYTVTLTVSTTLGRTLSRSVLLPVLALSSPPVANDTLVTNAGAPITDQNGNPLLVVPPPG